MSYTSRKSVFTLGSLSVYVSVSFTLLSSPYTAYGISTAITIGLGGSQTLSDTSGDLQARVDVSSDGEASLTLLKVPVAPTGSTIGFNGAGLTVTIPVTTDLTYSTDLRFASSPFLDCCGGTLVQSGSAHDDTSLHSLSLFSGGDMNGYVIDTNRDPDGNVNVIGWNEIGAAILGTGDATTDTLSNVKWACGININNTLPASFSLPIKVMSFIPEMPGVYSGVDEIIDRASLTDTQTVTFTPLPAISDALTLGEVLTDTWIQALREQVSLSTSMPTALLDALGAITEPLTFADVVAFGYRLLMSETLAVTDTPADWLAYTHEIADGLFMAAGPGMSLAATIAVAEAVALSDAPSRLFSAVAIDAFNISATPETSLRALLNALDLFSVADNGAATITWMLVGSEALSLSDTASWAAQLNATITDGVGLACTLTLDDGTYQAWVLNTESRAFVQYRNFPFNSFAQLGDRYLGAAPDGIYELSGDDDNGTPIDAVLRAGLADLGSGRLKGMPSMYVGYRSDDSMVLKVTVTDPDGYRQEHWYRMEPRDGALRENRVKLGRGLRSTYWGWELVNVNGADFALDNIAWYPVVLDRRLN